MPDTETTAEVRYAYPRTPLQSARCLQSRLMIIRDEIVATWPFLCARADRRDLLPRVDALLDEVIALRDALEPKNE